MRQRIINYLSLTKKEWNGSIVLVVAIIMVLVAPDVYKQLRKDKLINFKDFDKHAALLNHFGSGTPANGKPVGNAYAPLGVASNKLAPGQTIELNTTDSAMLTRVHGIGPSFARRIVAYRNKLGGFLNKEQLKEVYGLDDEKYAEIKDEIRVDPSRVKMIAVNTIDFDELRRLPYLSYKQANAIIQYRQQHGNYNSIEDMRDIAILNEDILRKIAPYITFK